MDSTMGTGHGAGALTDEELLAQLHAMAACEKKLGAEIVCHLIEVESRKLHVGLGYSSLYAYAIAELGWSENIAHKRVKAARAAAACPQIVHELASGALTLSSVFVLAPHLGTEAGPGLIAEARGKSRREVERQVAERFPKTPRGCQLRTRAEAGGKTRLEITISEKCEELLREAADLDSHRQADAAEILEQALAEYVEKRRAQCHGQSKKPQSAPRPCDAVRVSAATKREVHERDEGRCSFVGSDGHKCGSTFQLEYDHKTPRAHGGASHAGNIRLLCRVHNNFMAEQVIGKERVEAARAKAELARDCQLALTTLGYSKPVAKAAVASVSIAPDTPLEDVVRAALQAVPRPRARVARL